jgi:hypothetical protein
VAIQIGRSNWTCQGSRRRDRCHVRRRCNDVCRAIAKNPHSLAPLPDLPDLPDLADLADLADLRTLVDDGLLTQEA